MRSSIMRDVFWVSRLIRAYPLYRTPWERAGAFWRFLKWQVLGRLRPDSMQMSFVNGTHLRVRRRLGGRLHYVTGLAEFNDMAFVAHVLRRDEIFADVGANIGAYSLMAACCAGARCVAFEPMDEARRYLEENIALNGLEDRVAVQKVAVGAAAGTIEFAAGFGELSHVIRPGESRRAIQVPVVSLDQFFASGETPTVIKVDVEGFETEVIRGAGQLLMRNRPLALLLELSGNGARYGYDEAAVVTRLSGMGYLLCAYDARQRRLTRQSAGASPTHYDNCLFVADFDAAQHRLQTAPAFTLGRYSI